MADMVTLNEVDDDILFVTASALGNIADKLEAGEDIPNLADLLRVAAVYIAAVMSSAYERAIDADSNSVN